MNGISTGYDGIDEMLGALEPGDLVTAGGNCSISLRAFIQSVAVNAARSGVAVMLFTGGHIGPIPPFVKEAQETAASFIVDTEQLCSVDEIRAKAELAFEGTAGPKLVVAPYDYMLQFDDYYRELLDIWTKIEDIKEKVHRAGEAKKQALSQVALELKKLAEDLDASVLISSPYPSIVWGLVKSHRYKERLESCDRHCHRECRRARPCGPYG